MRKTHFAGQKPSSEISQKLNGLSNSLHENEITNQGIKSPLSIFPHQNGDEINLNLEDCAKKRSFFIQKNLSPNFHCKSF